MAVQIERMRHSWIVPLLLAGLTMMFAIAAWVLWPIWLKSREPVRIRAPWPVATDDGPLSVDSETPIIGMSFTVRARFPSGDRLGSIIYLRKLVDGRSVVYHSQNGGVLQPKMGVCQLSAEVWIQESIPPDTYDLEVCYGAETVASRRIQIIARPPHVPRNAGPETNRRASSINVPSNVEEAVRAVITAIDNRSWPEIQNACGSLKLIEGDSEAVDSLMVLLQDSDDDRRDLIFRAFAHIGPAAARAVPLLTESLDNRKLRHNASFALSTIGPNAASAVERLCGLLTENDFRDRALVALGGIGPAASPALPVIIDRLRIPRNDVNFVPQVVKDAFAGIGADSATALGSVLTDEDPSVRRRAAIALEHMGPAAQPALLALIAALSDHAVRDWAAAALGRIGPQANSAVPALVRLLDESDSALRICAARALGEIGPVSKQATPSLRKLLRDEYRVRVAAEEALSKIESADANQ